MIFILKGGIMKKGLFLLVFILFTVQPCLAGVHYQIDVLQLGDTDTFDRAYDGLLDGLARQGLVKGYNLCVERYVIDTRSTQSLFKRLQTRIMMYRICSSVVKRHPDLVITLGTPATNYFQDRITGAGIPMVYSSSTPSVSHMNRGITGVAVETTAWDVIHASILAIPHIKTIGIIHSADTNTLSFVSDARQCCEKLGLKVITKEVDMSESILPAAEELIARKVDVFLVPADEYYTQRGWKASRDLITISREHALPCISSLLSVTTGPVLYLSPDFAALGDVTATYARNILVEGIPPQDLLAVSLQDHNFVVDLNAAKTLGICFRPQSYNLLSMNN
jgi:putative ABC transport system substrate-binding protein